MLLQRHKFADVAGNLSQRLGVIGRAITAIRTSKAFRTVLEVSEALNFLLCWHSRIVLLYNWMF
jgi:hypothetical protein